MNIAIEQQVRINERIRVPQVRLIDQEGNQLGVVATMDALRMAREAEMDLVEVAPTERPPVCRIMDFGKQKYRQKKQKKHVHEQQLKEVRLRPNTDTHDLEVKMRKAREFFKKGDRVQFTMLMRGRERFHTDMALANMRDMAEKLSDVGHIERPARAEGRRITMVMVPGKATRPEPRPAPALVPQSPGAAAPAAPAPSTNNQPATAAPAPQAQAPQTQPQPAPAANPQA